MKRIRNYLSGASTAIGIQRLCHATPREYGGAELLNPVIALYVIQTYDYRHNITI